MIGVYDKADWHAETCPKSLPAEAHGAHIAMFFIWAAGRGMAGPIEVEEFADELALLADQLPAPTWACEQVLDHRLLDDNLDPQGVAFASAYYGERGYFDDLKALAARLKLPSMYHIPADWGSYEKIAAILDERFDAWAAGR